MLANKDKSVLHKWIRRGRQIVRMSDDSNNNNDDSNDSKIDLKALMGLDYKRFAHILPYRYFDDNDKLFINTESIGFACEVAPLAGANEEVINSIADMIKNKIDHNISVQVMLVGSGKTGHILDNVLEGYLSSDEVFKELGVSQYKYLKHASLRGFHNKRNYNMTIRDYRCFIFVSRKSGYNSGNAAKMCDLRVDIMTELKNAGLSNIKMDTFAFMALVKGLINHKPNDIYNEPSKIDQYRELNEQAVDPDFELTVHTEHLNIDSGESTQVVSLSLKQLPDQIALWTQADNFSNIFKPNMGIPCPFVISVHFKCEPQERSKLKAFRKANGYEKKANSPYAKLIPGTVQAAEDWKKIRDDLSSDSVQLCKVYYNCVLFTDEEQRREHVSKTIAAFRVNGLELYSIKYQQLQSFLALMPFVLEQGMWQDLATLGRLNTMTTWNLTNMLPIVAEYKGSQQCKGVLAPTFRHQAACIDNFDPGLDNYNVCISATSGSGKSVLSQTIIASVLADKGKVWVIDLGQSYKKFCETLSGNYMDSSNLRLNPFSSVTDISRSAESIRDLIAVMASPNEGISDVQKAHLLDAVIFAYKEKSTLANIDDVIRYLQSIDQSKSYDMRIDDIITLLKKFSPTLAPKGSIAARIFNDASLLNTSDLQKERFTVLELGELENQPDLLKSVLFALILNIEEQMYHSDQSRKKLCVIDEAWRLLSGSNKTAAAFIEKGFRTARKHKGAFVTITQKINDFYASSEAQAAWSCAENKIIMRQNEKSFKDFLNEQPDYFNEYEKNLIQSFKSSSVNGFSEFMVQQGAITSFHRLFLDPFSRIMYSSRAEEHQAVRELVEQGQTVANAVMAVAEKLYGDEIKKINMVGAI
jgi:conjugal transfer ATP-binding protein TraC